ncbi:hypothetical protein [Streptomyces sp. NPDC001717]|uniref:hypothetical protein n=1 Tax=Streptomyces sp. NPDC001717 TaxID=3364604 RepID=UPI0036B1E6BB
MFGLALGTAGWSLARYNGARESLVATWCEVVAWLLVLAGLAVLVLGYCGIMLGDGGRRRSAREEVRVPESDEVRAHGLKVSKDGAPPTG